MINPSTAHVGGKPEIAIAERWEILVYAMKPFQKSSDCSEMEYNLKYANDSLSGIVRVASESNMLSVAAREKS